MYPHNIQYRKYNSPNHQHPSHNFNQPNKLIRRSFQQQKIPNFNPNLQSNITIKGDKNLSREVYDKSNSWKSQQYIGVYHDDIDGNNRKIRNKQINKQKVGNTHTAEKQFITKTHNTPRTTVLKEIRGGHFQDTYGHEYIVIPKHKDKFIQQSSNVQQQQQYKQQKQYQPQKTANKNQLRLPTKPQTPQHNQYRQRQQNILQNRNCYQFGYNFHSNFKPINSVQNQIYSQKRGQFISIPRNSKLEDYQRHRRLGTNSQQFQDQNSKIHIEEQINQKQHNIENQEQIYDQPYQTYQQPLENQGNPYNMQYFNPIYNQNTNYQNLFYSPLTNFLKTKPNSPSISLPPTITPEIQMHYRNIQNIIQTQNKNLKEQNSYLLSVIKKLKAADRKQKDIIQEYSQKIIRITQERNAYMQRCLHLQVSMRRFSTSGNEDNKSIQRQYSLLNLENKSQNNPVSQANPHNETVNFPNIDLERQKKLGGLRQHLQKTLQKTVENAKPNIKYIRKSQPKTLNIPISTKPSAETQLLPYIANAVTPEFFSITGSPERQRPKTKISNSSNQSDQENSTILQGNSQIMMEDGSFGVSGWINTNSGLSVVKGLYKQLQNQNKLSGQQPQMMSGVASMGQQQQQGDSKTQMQQKDTKKTKKNSQTQSKQTSRIKTNQTTLKQLNYQFQQLMKVYHINQDIQIRKKCVQLAKKIKQLKLQIQKNQQYNSQQSLQFRSQQQEQSQYYGMNREQNVQQYYANIQYKLDNNNKNQIVNIHNIRNKKKIRSQTHN